MINPVIVRLQLIAAHLRRRLAEMRARPDAGYNTETTIVTALLAAAAITIVGIIVAKITTRANGINLGP